MVILVPSVGDMPLLMNVRRRNETNTDVDARMIAALLLMSAFGVDIE